MNQIIQSLYDRKSIRVFEEKQISESDKKLIIDAAIQAPTAGNQVLYTILDIDDNKIKHELSIICDNQPFIEKAPFVLIFLADCRKWYDAYRLAGIDAREPGVGDILLACEDALIAAQNAVIAAESLGIGSCYIGDILENKEKAVRLLNLDRYTLPITMLIFGYPTEQQRNRVKPKRFNSRYIVQKNRYSPMNENQIKDMFQEVHDEDCFDYNDYMKAFCARKYMSEFALEMNRSVSEYLKDFIKPQIMQ